MSKLAKPVYVTMPSLAPLDEFKGILEKAWESGILTHNGPLVQQLEKELKSYLRLKNIVAVTNGTIAIQLAIRAIGLKGEIITTPFTYIASVSAIVWEGCTPVFVDIDPQTLNIDPSKIESKINEKTCAVMPVHVFGNACDVETIDRIAKKHHLRVIYDAAHAFGVDYKGKSLLEYGDISATSFHATKLFNTAEGGGCVTTDDALHGRISRMRFFGHDENRDVVDNGCNAKMTEVHAALGLANLKYIDQVKKDREIKYRLYRSRLSSLKWIQFQTLNEGACNYSYMPIIIETETKLLKVERNLEAESIFPRRYFYPSVNTYTNIMPYSEMPVSEDISKRILCLPLYYMLATDTVNRICDIIIKS